MEPSQNFCNPDGKLNENFPLWSAIPFKNVEIHKNPLRKKRWNHYMFMSKDFIFVFAIVDLDYSGIIFLNFYDIKKDSFLKYSSKIPFSRNINLDSNIDSFARYIKKDKLITVTPIDNHLNISINWGKINLNTKIYLGNESLNVIIPWSNKRFHYTSKQLALETAGTLSVNKTSFDLSDSLACIDYGRGIWEYEKSWYWLTSIFKTNAHVLGINLGSKWTDNSGTNENGLVLDGQAIKLKSDVKFTFDHNTNTWSIKSVDSSEVGLTFTPFANSAENHNLLIVKGSLKQFIGKLNGVIEVENETFHVVDAISWFEDHYAKW